MTIAHSPALAETTEPRIVYETDLVTLWHGGAEDVLPTYRTETFELVIADPPYGVNYKSGMRADSWAIHGDGDGLDDRVIVHQILLECVRLVRQNRHLYVFGPEVLRSELDAKVTSAAKMIWDKQTVLMGDLSLPWGPQHEELHFYVSQHRHGGKRGKDCGPVRLRKGSVLSYSRRTGRTLRHPTEKPLDLLTELIESSSRVGETILDPTAGVASTGVAAVLAGRKTVLIESDERWIPVAIERLRNAERLRVEMAGL